MDEIPSDIWLPVKVWDLLNASLLSGGDSNPGGGGNHGAQANAGHGNVPPDSTGSHGSSEKAASSTLEIVENQQKFLFSKINVYFKEKNPEVFKKPSLKFEFSKGGGAIDMAQFLGEKKGTFFVGFDFPEWTEATDLKVYFVSRFQRRRVSGEIHGVGCNKILDITNAFLHHMKEEGIVVNSTNARYLNVLGGSFIFSARKNKDTFLSQVTFADSQNTNGACPVDLAERK